MYEEKNVAHKSNINNEILDRYTDEIKERNAADIELYNHVNQSILPQQITQYQGRFDRDLLEFKARNKLGFIRTVEGYVDYVWRKFYIEPVTGLIRRCNGLPSKGHYGQYGYPDKQPW